MTPPPPNAGQAMVDAAGRPTAAFQVWLGRLRDAVDDAARLAAAAVPSDRNVVAVGGLRAGGPLSDEVGIALYHTLTAVSLLPTVGIKTGDWAFALDGRKPGEAAGAGTGVPVFWSAGAWIAAPGGAPVTA